MTRVLPAADTALLLEAADLDEAMRLLPALHAAASSPSASAPANRPAAQGGSYPERR